MLLSHKSLYTGDETLVLRPRYANGARLFVPGVGVSGTDKVTGKAFTGSLFQVESGPLGRYYKQTGANGYVQYAHDVDLDPPSDGFALAMRIKLMAPIYNNNYPRIFHKGYQSSGSTNAFGFYASRNDSPPVYVYGFCQNGSTTYSVGMLASEVYNKYVWLVLSFDGSLLSMSVDGRVVGSTTASAPAASTSALRIGSNQFDGSTSANFEMVMAAYLRASIPLADRQSEWQLFAPSRLYIPTSTAAATVPTLSNLSARLITSSSAQPQIDYTF